MTLCGTLYLDGREYEPQIQPVFRRSYGAGLFGTGPEPSLHFVDHGVPHIDFQLELVL